MHKIVVGTLPENVNLEDRGDDRMPTLKNDIGKDVSKGG